MKTKNSVIKKVGKDIWNTACKVRSKVSPNKFQDLILGFIFYKYLSEHQKSYLKQNGFFYVKPNQSFNDAYKEATQKDGLDTYLQVISKDNGYAISPEDTWDSIMYKIDNNKIVPEVFPDILDDFNKNAQLNASVGKDFRGIFSNINFQNNQLGKEQNTRTKTLISIAKLADKLPYTDKQGNDILGGIYEYLIGRFSSNAGRNAGEFYTPHSLSKVIAKLVTVNIKNIQYPFSVYDPACGSGSLLLTAQDEVPDGHKRGHITFYGQEINPTTYNLARMNLIMHGVDFHDMRLNVGDTLGPDWPDGKDIHGIDHPRNVDAVIENPMFHEHWDNKNMNKDPRFKDYGVAPAKQADFAFILHGLYHLNNTGTMAIIMDNGVLFRSNTKAEFKIRKNLILKNNIDAVIEMPSNMFHSTSAPAVILVLKQNRVNRNILFIDASKEFKKVGKYNVLSKHDINKIVDTYKYRKDIKRYSRNVTLNEIKKNRYNINVPRYVDTFIPKPDINIEKVKNKIFYINKKIAHIETKFNEMGNQLRWTNKKDR